VHSPVDPGNTARRQWSPYSRSAEFRDADKPLLGGIMTIRLNGSGSYEPNWLAKFHVSAVAGDRPVIDRILLDRHNDHDRCGRPRDHHARDETEILTAFQFFS
jgi:hypothetical protein